MGRRAQGTRIYNPKEGEFKTELGPIFAHLLLADEINRAPAKVQSALLEAMQERQVTLGKETYPLPKPFLVLATQNPIESEGTYPLPEAQLDRFLLKVVVGYPAFHKELLIVGRMTTGEEIQVAQVLSLEEVLELSRLAARHDLVGVLVEDPLERALPRAGVLFFVDPETGAQVEVNTLDPRVREAYRLRAEAASLRLGPCLPPWA